MQLTGKAPLLGALHVVLAKTLLAFARRRCQIVVVAPQKCSLSTLARDHP